ncbi:CU044_5270 family protein [Kineococcus sp. TBRC 1896]|uniref:CU044_5270 family protein n=1 Tax=Kineococcus mangrovi TaxID=1660183 RepID=A0ABV4I8Y9_9ACTN
MSTDDRRRPVSSAQALQELRRANPVPAADVVDARTDLRASYDLDRILIGDITPDDLDVARLEEFSPQNPGARHLPGARDDSGTSVTTLRPRRDPRTPAGVGRPPWRRSGPRLAAAAVAVAVAITVGVGIAQPGSAPVARAETPPALVIDAPAARTSGTGTLQQMAQLAAAQPALPAAKWRYFCSIDYSTVTSYYRNDNGEDVTAVQVVPGRSEVWLAADGAAHRRMVSAGGSKAWSSDGTIDPSLIDPAGTTTDDVTYAGQDSAQDLPTDPVALKAQLDREEPAPEGGKVSGYLSDLYNRFSAGLPTPAQQAAIWQVLADTDDLDYLGTTTDRAGRAALVVSYDTTGTIAGQKRYQLLIDPGTGLLLAHEEIALKTSAMWAQQAPAVMGGTTWLAAASADSLDVPPATGTIPRG